MSTSAGKAASGDVSKSCVNTPLSERLFQNLKLSRTKRGLEKFPYLITSLGCIAIRPL
ncbi:hypothetical protein [Neorhizobium petrolearium]|uniref:hypothetical protein n=1 Tax=Neorhizobium petrolearium TaxID=515361 RepID=UPI003F1604F0